MTYDVIIDGRSCRVHLAHVDLAHRDLAEKTGQWLCTVDDREVRVDAVLVRPNVLSLIVGDVSYHVKREKSATGTFLWIGSSRYETEVRDPRSLHSRRAAGGEAGGTRKIVAPMPGKVVRVLVKEHDAVQAGQGVVVVEAMKMQNELKSPKQGTVQKVVTAEGASVNAGDVLLIVE